MKRTHLVLLALAAVPMAAIGAQQQVSIQRAASRTVSVRLNGFLSNVHVIGWDRDSVALTGGIATGSRLEGGPQGSGPAVTGMKFYVDATDEVAARANKLELRVPRGARVWIKAGSADIDVTGVTGSLDLNIVGGSVHVNGKVRELVVESMDGAVSFDGSATYARLKTATGDIRLATQGEDFGATSISGNLTIGDGTYERARFESVTGSITFGGDIAPGGDVRFETHSGPIDVRLKPQANVEIEAESLTGVIENMLNSRRPSVGREGRGMQLSTSSGTGGASVQVRSFKGNVKLTAK